MRISLVVCLLVLAILSPCVAYSQTPDWVKEYRRAVRDMSYSYSEDGGTQSSLLILLQTKRGTCMAFAKLGIVTALKSGLIAELIFAIEKRESPSRVEHALALIHDFDGRLWCVSNKEIYRVKSEDDAVNWSDREEWMVSFRQVFRNLTDVRFD